MATKAEIEKREAERAAWDAAFAWYFNTQTKIGDRDAARDHFFPSLARRAERVTLSDGVVVWYAPHVTGARHPWAKRADVARGDTYMYASTDSDYVLTADDHEKCAAAIRAYEKREGIRGESLEGLEGGSK